MSRFVYIQPDELEKLPTSAGVYAFLDTGGEFLYIGKAVHLRSRVRNHFREPGFKHHFWIGKVARIAFEETASEIAALLREAELINHYQPQFNVMWRDDKNYFYVAVTNEEYPRVYITHQPVRKVKEGSTENGNANTAASADFIGPFVDGTALKTTLKYLRRIFPYYTKKRHPATKCQWCHIGLCPGPDPDKSEYRYTVKQLTEVLSGRKDIAIEEMEERMKKAASREQFEEAAAWRDRIESLQRVMDNARILRAQLPTAEHDWEAVSTSLRETLGCETDTPLARVEAYDVSNIQGRQPAASHVTFVQGAPDTNYYRRYRIRSKESPDDYAMLKEVLQRRLSHTEWPLPDLILIDGGRGQLNAALSVIGTPDKEGYGTQTDIPVAALAKQEEELYVPGKEKPIALDSLPRETAHFLKHIRDEAHRFAVSYHRKRRHQELTT